MNEYEFGKDILFDIEMQLYDEFNDKIATMNDHLGEIYSYKDVEDVKQTEQHRKIELMEKAIKELQKENKKLNHYKLLYQKVKERVDELEADMKFVLEQTLGAFTQNWCIDWNFTDIREKYSISDNYEWNKENNEE